MPVKIITLHAIILKRVEYGFIKEFESTIGAIVGYMDFGIENQDSPVMENAYEVPLYREIAA